MDWFYIALFCTQSTLKARTLNPLLFHTVITLVMASYICSHSYPGGGSLTEAWQPIRAKRPLRPLPLTFTRGTVG